MDGNGIREFPVPLRRLLKNRVKDVLLALVVLVQGRRPDAYGVRDLLDAYGVVSLLRKQAKGFQQDFLFGMDGNPPPLLR